MNYEIVRAIDNSASGTRVTGLTPVVAYAKTLAGGVNVASHVTISELASGDYLVAYDAISNGDASIQVDLTATLPLTGDRYKSLVIRGTVNQTADVAAGVRLATSERTALAAATRSIPRERAIYAKPAGAIHQTADSLADGAEVIPLCAGTGNDVTAPNAYTVTLGNSPSWVDGDYGKTVQLVRASSHYLDLGHCLSPAALPMTVAIRFRPDAIGSVVQGLFSTSGNTTLYGLSAYITAAGKIVICLADGLSATPAVYTSYQYWTSYKTLTAAKWYNVVVVVHSTTSIELWVQEPFKPAELWSTSAVDNSRGYAAGTGNTVVGRAYSTSAYLYGSETIDAMQVASVAWDGNDVARWCADPWRTVRTTLAQLITTAGLDNDTSIGMAIAINGVNQPSAVHDITSKRTFITWQNHYSRACVCYFDHTTRTLSPSTSLGGTSLLLDSHGAPAIAMDADGYLYVFYGSHSSAQKWRKSTYPRDTQSWGAEQSLASGNYTYPNPWLLGNDTIALFMREFTAGEDYVYLVMKIYDGSTWAADVRIAQDLSIYFISHHDPVHNVLHVMFQPNIQVDSHREDAYYMKSADNGVTWTKADGTALSLPADITTADKVWDSGGLWSNVPVGQFDVDSAGNPLFVWNAGQTPPGPEADGYIKFTRWDGTVWTTPVNIVAVDNVFDSATIRVESDTHFLATVTSGDSTLTSDRGGTLSEYESFDAGATWALKQLVMGGNVGTVTRVHQRSDDGQADLLFAGGDDGLGSLYLWGPDAAKATEETLFEGQSTKYDVIAADVSGLDGAAMRGTDSAYTGTPPTVQEIRDAMKLAPTAGDPAAGSVDKHLDDILEDTGTTLPAAIAAIPPEVGEGAYTGTLTVNDGATGLEGVVVNATRGGVLIATGITNASGQITDWVFDAYTYNLAVRLSGYQPTTSTITVSGNAWTKTISLTAISITAPAAPTLCTAQLRLVLSDTAVAGAIFKARLLGINQASDGTILSTAEMSDSTDALGIAELQLVQKGSIVKGSGIYRLWVEINGNPVASVETTIPSQSTILFEDLL